MALDSVYDCSTNLMDEVSKLHMVDCVGLKMTDHSILLLDTILVMFSIQITYSLHLACLQDY